MPNDLLKSFYRPSLDQYALCDDTRTDENLKKNTFLLMEWEIKFENEMIAS